MLSKPATVRLNVKTVGYSAIRVTAISTTSLTVNVGFPGGGSGTSTMGLGIGTGSFGTTGLPRLEVGLTTVDGKPALVLQPGPVT
nr:hypothetical protein [Kibdelosporangium sp. MJ126-NF4]CEL19826.1 hypothetical protein [Kibdelosporangium sp. MJ126-NF4]